MIGETGLVMRRRGSTELLDLAAVLLRRDARRVLLGVLPAWALAAASAAAAWWIDPWLGVLVGVFVGRLAQLPTLLVVSDRAAGRPQPGSLRRTFSGWWATVPTTLYYGIGLLFAALIPPLLVYVWGRMLFIPEVTAIERPESGAAERVSALAGAGTEEVAAARFWQVALEAWSIVSITSMGNLLVTDVLGLGEPFGSVWSGDASPFFILGSLVAQPMLSAIRFCFYLNVRTRREGIDAWFLLWATTQASRSP
ncbi:hypothetical protein LBMAG42_39390 [Deltaproteobacteria bacterium]|nr:hypothetical protein LBMAG42_39390 [Deltaproteobacteria bacterium]